jgi:hypothetical protein
MSTYDIHFETLVSMSSWPKVARSFDGVCFKHRRMFGSLELPHEIPYCEGWQRLCFAASLFALAGGCCCMVKYQDAYS